MKLYKYKAEVPFSYDLEPWLKENIKRYMWIFQAYDSKYLKNISDLQSDYNWFRKQNGKHTLSLRSTVIIDFIREEDAVAFKLRWL